MTHVERRIYAERLKKFAGCLGEKGVALVPGARERIRNADNVYPFRQESNLLYLTGWNEPDALLVVLGGMNPRAFLFCEEPSPEHELWGGKRMGPADVHLLTGINEGRKNHPRDACRTEILSLVGERDVAYYPMNHERDFGFISTASIIETLQVTTGQARLCMDSDDLIGMLREHKDDAEIMMMGIAGGISARAHRSLLGKVRPGMMEYEIEALLAFNFRKAGGDPAHAYPPIVASGKNACTLHYNRNDARITDGDLLLVDAGCEVGGYASDITRTFPVSGKFSRAQRSVYELVFRAQKNAISACWPGHTMEHVHETAVGTLIVGLMDLELLPRGDWKECYNSGAHKHFIPHGTSHFIGLDVHDTGNYEKDMRGRNMRRLTPGMVITVEPGIYLTGDIPPHYANIGVRIEDEVLITEAGPVVLTHEAPKEPDEIEWLMSEGRGILSHT